MATRFYFPDNDPPAIYPDLSLYQDFDDVASATVHTLSITKQSTPFYTHEVANGNSAYYQPIVRRYVIPLAAQTLQSTCTLKAQFRCKEEDATMNVDLMVGIYLYDADGLNDDPDYIYSINTGVELATVLTNRKGIQPPPDNGVWYEIDITEGQLLVVDVGINIGSTDTKKGYIEFGDNSPNDLPEDETSTDQYCSWIEFSQDLLLYEEPPADEEDYMFVNSYDITGSNSTFTYNQVSPSATWWVEHYLDTYEINVRVYSGGTEVEPDEIWLYNKNWTVITFSEPTTGYVDIYLSESSFIPAIKVVEPDITTIDENNILVTLPTSAMGYVSCAVAGLRCSNLLQSSPMHSHIVDENNITATFLPEAAGVAAVREIGQLTYGAGLVMSPHYKVEIDINCEPLTPPNIVEKHIFEHFISSLEFSRPACKYAHYSILVSPKTDFTGTQIDLYDEQFDPRIYSWCCVDTTPISGGFVYSQYTASSYWTITHNLYNWDVMVQCYDFDRELVFPAEVLVVDENTVKIAFHTPQRGFALILEASETFTNTATASGSWGVPYDLDSAGPSAAISDFYFYNREQLVPSNIEIVSIDRLEALWYVPTLGYCQLHEYNYLHLQYDAREDWTINHNLTYDGIFIQCFDLNHNVIEPYKIKLNKYTKNCTVSFGDRNTGYAIVTAVGNSLTKGYIIESIANGGYIKVGSGTNTYTWDPRLYNMMKEEYDVQEYNEETVLGGLDRETRVADVLTSTNVVLTEDVFRYYISGIVQSGTTEESFKEKDITEMALFTAEGDLVFYTYVRHPAQFYKTKLTDIKILYRIEK